MAYVLVRKKNHKALEPHSRKCIFVWCILIRYPEGFTLTSTVSVMPEGHIYWMTFVCNRTHLWVIAYLGRKRPETSPILITEHRSSRLTWEQCWYRRDYRAQLCLGHSVTKQVAHIMLID